MQNLQKILKCRKNWRCNRPLSCPNCGNSWRKAKFKGFSQCLDNLDEVSLSKETVLTYIVITSNKLGTLKEKLQDMFTLLNEVKKLKKKGKLPIFFGRLEFSFKKDSLGFNPHLNLLVWGDYSIFENLSNELGLNFWKKEKTNNKETAKSIAWYMLKFNSIGIEKGEAVRKALNKKRTIVNSKEFTFKSINYIDEYIDIDFSFMGVYPIRSEKEILLRAEHKKTLKKLRVTLNAEIETANKELFEESY